MLLVKVISIRLYILVIFILLNISNHGTVLAEKVWKSFTSDQSVYDIAFREPYLYCATANGPVRWDTRTMQYEMMEGIQNNRTQCVAVDTHGDVWFGTTSGLARFDGTNWFFYTKNEGLAHNDVTAITADQNGAVIFASSKVTSYYEYSYDCALQKFDGSVITTLLSDTYVFYKIKSMTISENGEIGAVQYDSLVRFNGSEWEEVLSKEEMPVRNPEFIESGPDESLWIGGGNSVYLRNGEGWDCLNISVENVLTGVVNEGVIQWIGSMNGLINPNNKDQIYVLDNVPYINFFNKIALDTQGTLWAAGDIGYIQSFDGETWELYLASKTGINSNVTDILPTDMGIWFGTEKGAFLHDGSDWLRFAELDSLPDNYIKDMGTSINDSIIFVTKSGLCSYDGNKWSTIQTPDSLTFNTVCDNNNQEIFAGVSYCTDTQYNGISRYNGGIWTTSIFNKMLVSDNWYSISSIHRDSDRKLWAFCLGNTSGSTHSPNIKSYVYIYEQEQWKKVTTIDGYFSSYAISKDGSIWIGTWPYSGMNSWDEGGLYLRQTGTTKYTTENGLISNNIRALAVDGENNLWVGTGQGLTFYGELISIGPTTVQTLETKPDAVRILYNYPNPFNPTTTIEFSLPESGFASLVIYNAMGQKVRELISDRITRGTHSVVWDGIDDSGKPVSSGIYLSRVSAGTISATGSMLLLK